MDTPKAIRENIIQKAFDFMKYLIPVLMKLPRDQKFLLGDRLQNLASDIFENLLEAYYAPKNLKKPLLRKTNLQLEKLRFYNRLLNELGYIPQKRYLYTSGLIQELGKMVGGWYKSL